VAAKRITLAIIGERDRERSETADQESEHRVSPTISGNRVSGRKRNHVSGTDLYRLAHPTRFERVTFAFGGQLNRLALMLNLKSP